MNTRYYYTAKETVLDIIYEDNIVEWINWCNTVLGRQSWQWHGPAADIPNSISFEREEDLLAFKLRFQLP